MEHLKIDKNDEPVIRKGESKMSQGMKNANEKKVEAKQKYDEWLEDPRGPMPNVPRSMLKEGDPHPGNHKGGRNEPRHSQGGGR